MYQQEVSSTASAASSVQTEDRHWEGRDALRASRRALAVPKTCLTAGSCGNSCPGASYLIPPAGPEWAAGGYSQADTDAMKGAEDLDRIASQSTWYP